MLSKLLHEESGLKTYVLVLETDDEPMSALLDFARKNRVSAAHFTAIGAFSDVLVQYFDWQTRSYLDIPLMEQMEVLALTGDVSLKGDEPKVHAHVVLGRPDGTTRGGHLKQAHVRPTLEVMLTETPANLRRTYDPESGLALIRP